MKRTLSKRRGGYKKKKSIRRRRIMGGRLSQIIKDPTALKQYESQLDNRLRDKYMNEGSDFVKNINKMLKHYGINFTCAVNDTRSVTNYGSMLYPDKVSVSFYAPPTSQEIREGYFIGGKDFMGFFRDFSVKWNNTIKVQQKKFIDTLPSKPAWYSSSSNDMLLSLDYLTSDDLLTGINELE